MLEVLEPGRLLFLKPNLSPILFQLLLDFCRTVGGSGLGNAVPNSALDVGGVSGGVIGSKADNDGDAESVLSSVMLSNDSGSVEDEVTYEPPARKDGIPEVLARLREVVMCDC